MRKVVLICLLMGLMSQMHSGPANGKGLIPPKEIEIAKLGNRKVAHVAPNKIGAARIRMNHEKLGMGVPELKVATTNEAEFVLKGTSSQSAFLLPAAVDNSLLPSFPPIGDQKLLGSCVSWASTYYQATHEYGLANGFNNKSTPSHILSPKWTYNLLNYGQDGGLNIIDAYTLLTENGAVPFANFPYDGRDFLTWDLNPEDWILAMSARMKPYKTIGGLDSSPQNLTAIKQALANGHVLTFGTGIESWVLTKIKANNSTQNHAVGQWACSWVNGVEGGHCLTVVGYDDDIWIDVNGNGQVDAGEMGAFLIANSWGSSWGNKGFIWISYDAFLSHSAVPNGPSQGRVGAAALIGSVFISAVPKAAHYVPAVVGQFNINQFRRNQFKIACGSSDFSHRVPQHYQLSTALNYQGGGFSFNGASGTKSQNALFSLDMTDLINASGDTRYYLMVVDREKPSPTQIDGLSILNINTGASVHASPFTSRIDGQKLTAVLDYSYKRPTPAKNPIHLQITSPANQDVLTGTVPLSVQPSRHVETIQFYLDSQLIAIDPADPYLVLLDTTKVMNGTHQISFVAYDAWNQSAKDSITVEIQN
ncbi:MAG: hypothetical protein JSS32_03975 [Verrucomicrobia bacterium]|nr:hypothetical protein [Verrucomicrobiota bacterium]